MGLGAVSGDESIHITGHKNIEGVLAMAMTIDVAFVGIEPAEPVGDYKDAGLKDNDGNSIRMSMDAFVGKEGMA